MPVAISDLEYALGRDRNDALDALATANSTITRQNAEIVRLRRLLAASNGRVVELEKLVDLIAQ